MNENEKSSKKAAKKKILVFFIILAAAAVILPIINMVDFDALLPKRSENEKPKTTTVTLGSHHFTEPDYEEDIMSDEDYLEKNRFLHYTYENETFEVNGDAATHGSVCAFFDEYFQAVISGDYEKYNTMFTDEYIEEYGRKTFAPQKIYNISAVCLRSSYLENGDANGAYKGYYVYYFDVSYNIMDNNGTFRNDFLGDEGTLPLIFEIIEGGNEIKISSINVYGNPGDVTTPVSPNAVLIIIFAVLLLLLILAEVLTKKLVALSLAVASAVGLVLALLNVDIGAVIISAFLVGALLVVLRFTLLKKFLKNFKWSAKKQKNSVNIDRGIN